MSRSITSSSQVSDPSGPTERGYSTCPLCGSTSIKFGQEHLVLQSPRRGEIQIQVARWACGECGEKFLTAESRRQIDAALGLR